MGYSPKNHQVSISQPPPALWLHFLIYNELQYYVIFNVQFFHSYYNPSKIKGHQIKNGASIPSTTYYLQYQTKENPNNLFLVKTHVKSVLTTSAQIPRTERLIFSR